MSLQPSTFSFTDSFELKVENPVIFPFRQAQISKPFGSGEKSAFKEFKIARSLVNPIGRLITLTPPIIFTSYNFNVGTSVKKVISKKAQK